MPDKPANSLWVLTRGHRFQYSVPIACMAVGTVFLLSVPFALKGALDALNRQGATLRGTLLPAAGLIVALNAFNGVFTYLRGKLAAQAREGIVRIIRHRLYANMERLPSR